MCDDVLNLIIDAVGAEVLGEVEHYLAGRCVEKQHISTLSLATASTCLALRQVNRSFNRCVDRRAAPHWRVLFALHDPYNNTNVLPREPWQQYRAALWGLLEGRRCIEQMRRILAEQRVVYRTPTGRTGSPIAKLGVKKLQGLAKKVNGTAYKTLVKDQKRLHRIYLDACRVTRKCMQSFSRENLVL